MPPRNGGSRTNFFLPFTLLSLVALVTNPAPSVAAPSVAGGSCSGCGGSDLAKYVNQAMNRILDVLYEKSDHKKPSSTLRLNLGALEGSRSLDVNDLNASFHGAIRVDGESILIAQPGTSDVHEITEFEGNPVTGQVTFLRDSVDKVSDDGLIEDFAHEICRTNHKQCPPELENRYLVSQAIAARIKGDPELLKLIGKVRIEARRRKALESDAAMPIPCGQEENGGSASFDRVRSFSAGLQAGFSHLPSDDPAVAVKNLFSPAPGGVNREAYVTANGNDRCRSVRATLVASGLVVPITNCYPSVDGNPQNYVFRFETKDQTILRGSPVDAKACAQAARAFYDSSSESTGESLAGYCEPLPGSSSERILVLDTYSDKSGVSGSLTLQNSADCEHARDAIIDSGLGVYFKPAACGIDGALPMVTEASSVIHDHVAPVAIARADCAAAAVSLSGFLYDSTDPDRTRAFVARCVDAAESSGLAYLRVRTYTWWPKKPSR